MHATKVPALPLQEYRSTLWQNPNRISLQVISKYQFAQRDLYGKFTSNIIELNRFYVLTSSSHSVYIFLCVAREIVIYHVGYVFDVKPT